MPINIRKTIKDHEVAQLVNKLTEVTKKHHASQSLRERISREVIDFLVNESDIDQRLRHTVGVIIPCSIMITASDKTQCSASELQSLWRRNHNHEGTLVVTQVFTRQEADDIIQMLKRFHIPYELTGQSDPS